MQDYVWGIPEEQCDFIVRIIDWRRILSGKSLGDIRHLIQEENAMDGPYSWDLACRIAKIMNVKSDLETPDAKVAFEEWLNKRFAHWIKKEKLQGVKRPKTHKGFWESLFG